MVSSLKPVDLVFISNDLPFDEQIIRAIRPNVIVTPSDEPSNEIKAKFASEFQSKNPNVELIMKARSSFPRSSSTTDIIQKILSAFGQTEEPQHKRPGQRYLLKDGKSRLKPNV